MAIVRWGTEGSDVYLYESTGMGCVVCCGCALTDKTEPLPTNWDANAHIAEHRAAGHHVPAYVDIHFL